MYNNNSNFYGQCCCYPENWNHPCEKDERYYREDNDSQWENWDNNRKENNDKFDSYGRDYRCRCLTCKNHNQNHNCCCNNFCRENMEQREHPRAERSNCGCCLCNIFRICR